MKLTRPDAVNQVLSLLRSYGFEVRRMPEMKTKTCDIIARYRYEDYYIEVKERLGRQRPGDYRLRSGYNSSVNAIVEHGVAQLTGMPGQRTIYRILWFIIPEDDERELLLQSIVHTLYAAQRLS